MKKKIVYIDLDDTIADFYNAAKDRFGYVDERNMYTDEFFFKLKPIPKAQEAVRYLIYLGFDVQILTQPLATHFASYSDKAKWIQVYFPELYNKINMAQDKGNFLGHYLVDDNATKWQAKFEANGGKFIHYRYAQESNNTETLKKEWTRIMDFFQKEDPTY